ncbi:MAG: aminopeptidase P family protein [Rhodospirillales bacterium]|nr:aminopeptidase P family protein [Rhodospirillales bacterium]
MAKIRTFDDGELAGRVARARASIRAAGLDALLLFSQESLHYLTGYDTTGYVFFQCAVLTADATPTVLLTRRPDVAQARDTSTIEDIRVWYNAVDVNPARELKTILAEKGLKGARIGVEFDTYGLTAANGRLLEAELNGWCTLTDSSDIVRRLRLVKSPAEIAYVRKAAELADAALQAMTARIVPGVLDGAVTAAGITAIMEGGGDMPPDGPIVNTGPRAIYGRSVGGGHAIERDDQVMIELAATYARYNACIERTTVVGRLDPRQQHMFETTREALAAMTAAARPGRPLGEIDDAHRRALDKAGYGVHRYSACGYSLGNTYRPSWMDVPPMIFSGNPLTIEPGMVLFPHVMLGDTDRRLAVGTGYTILIGPDGAEVLSRLPVELLRR